MWMWERYLCPMFDSQGEDHGSQGKNNEAKCHGMPRRLLHRQRDPAKVVARAAEDDPLGRSAGPLG